jgi:hypothetical protein
MPPRWSRHKARLAWDELTQCGMFRDISCKPFVSFGLQGRNAMSDPKTGQSFVSLHCRLMWSPIYSKLIKLLVSKKKVEDKVLFYHSVISKIWQLFFKLKIHQVFSIHRIFILWDKIEVLLGTCWGMYLRMHRWSHFLHWWKMSGLVHWPAQMTHMYHHTLTGQSRLLYCEPSLLTLLQMLPLACCTDSPELSSPSFSMLLVADGKLLNGK